MTAGAGAGSVREILVVLALAVAGLLLAMAAAFTPWYGTAAGSTELEVVEMYAPPPAIGGVAAASDG
ncbi:hypothetical protein [Micromonospora sp. HM5-17]|uniref:hypothetical protein n=1 Tax=Micromonospora sp. HM5-17 TaxID=2487710 RepID=UPI0011CD3C56|nr:hypothetical protein [Micromonospora sp. HM5-17]